MTKRKAIAKVASRASQKVIQSRVATEQTHEEVKRDVKAEEETKRRDLIDTILVKRRRRKGGRLLKSLPHDYSVSCAHY